MSQRFVDFLVDFDIFGQPIGVNYKGKDVFKTKIGALITLMVYIVIIFNFVSLSQDFMNNSKQT